MKIFKYTFGLLLGTVVFLSSCRDFVEPRIPYSDFDTAAYLRTITRTSTTFNLFDFSNSKFEIAIEAVDAEDGATVETVEVRVRHRRLIQNVGLIYTPTNDVIVKTLQKSDFAPNADSRFLRSTIVVTAAEAIAAVGLKASDIQGADVFEFRLVLNDRFGRVFTNTNISGDMTAPFYNSPFFYPVSVVCPSDLAGTFDYTSTSGFCAAAANTSGKATLTAVAGIPGSYRVTDASFGLYDACYPSSPWVGNVRINDACGKLSMSGTDSFGDSYTFTYISSDATNLTFAWINTFGEGGTVTLKSNAEKPWPATLR